MGGVCPAYLLRLFDANLTKEEMKCFDKSCSRFGIKYNALVDKSNPKEVPHQTTNLPTYLQKNLYPSSYRYLQKMNCRIWQRML